jgi:hypothetical protein
MDNLSAILEETMRWYAGRGANGRSYFMKDDAEQVMSVVAKFVFQDKHYVDTSLLARIVADRIIIEDDKTNKPLVDALLQAGVPREQIVLAYAGESVEETA